MFESFGIFSFLLASIGLMIFGLDSWDQRALAGIQRIKKKHPALTLSAQLFSWTPFSVFMLFILPASLWWMLGSEVETLALFLSCTIAVGSAFIVKFVFHRARPGGRLTRYGELDSSFPSAHTAGPFAAAIIIADVLPGVVIFALCFATAVAASRVWLELHFVSDIGGGLLLAYVATWLVTQTELLPTAISFLGLI